jgi:ATP-dependent helicase/DNAse subunit B
MVEALKLPYFIDLGASIMGLPLIVFITSYALKIIKEEWYNLKLAL